MSRQKSITSFFTKAVAKAADIVAENGIKENKTSPLKKATGTLDIPLVDAASTSPKPAELPTKKRRWNRLQSDSEASEEEDITSAASTKESSVNDTKCSPTHLEGSSSKAKEDSVETTSPKVKCRKIGDLRGGFGAKTLDPGILSNKSIIFPSKISEVCAFSTSGTKDPAATRNGVLETNTSSIEFKSEPNSNSLSSQISGYANCVAVNGTHKNTGDESSQTDSTRSKADVLSSPNKLESQVKLEPKCVGSPVKGASIETGMEIETKPSGNETDLSSPTHESEMKLETNSGDEPVNCDGSETGGEGNKSGETKTEESIPVSPDTKARVVVKGVGSPVKGKSVGTEDNADGSTSPITKSENKQITQKPDHQDKVEKNIDTKKEIHSFFAPRKSSSNPNKEKKLNPPKKTGAEQKSLPTKKAESGKSSEVDGDRETNFDPSKKNYHPIKDAFWNRGDNVPYLALAKTLEEIEAVSARLKIVEILSNYLRSVIVLSPDDLLPSIYLCLNKLAPAYEGVELGIAETTLMKAIAQSTGRSVAQIKSDSTATGDLGIVAEQSRSNQRMMFQPAKLTVKNVFERIKEIALMTGHASMSKKVDKIQSMFVACRHSEARYLIRSLAGKLRIGLAEQSVLQALALACATTPPEQAYPHEVLNNSKEMSAEAFKALVDECSLIIKTTYCECPNYNMIVPILLKEGVAALPKHCRLSPGIPLKPMLAHPTKGVHEVLHRFDGQKFTCEWKYDGERAQIHLHEDKTVSIYSRNQENNTTKYPDITGRLSKALGPDVTSCILDCEAVAWDKEKKQILPFQILSTRKRKDANESEIKVAVCVFMFDLLYLNGRALVKETLSERRQLLRDNFLETEGEFIFATSLDTSTMDEVQNFLEDAVKGNCEGLMVKTLESDATYEIAKRSRNWLKLKKDYLEGVGDTIDVVVIGGYLGRGKRTGAYGGFLLACYDPDNEEYQSLCKIGTGFSDESLQQHSEFFKDNIIKAPRPYYRYDSSHEPDHWFDAVQVWEIKCADLSLSPVHRAALGIVDPEKGISLRFPRFLRVRDDKAVEDATSASEVAELYNKQDQVKNQTSSKVAEEDFY